VLKFFFGSVNHVSDNIEDTIINSRAWQNSLKYLITLDNTALIPSHYLVFFGFDFIFF
jgi:hypothetical protein